jgi:hypothetical protein
MKSKANMTCLPGKAYQAHTQIKELAINEAINGVLASSGWRSLPAAISRIEACTPTKTVTGNQQGGFHSSQHLQ